jgi:hypothetical protein
MNRSLTRRIHESERYQGTRVYYRVLVQNSELQFFEHTYMRMGDVDDDRFASDIQLNFEVARWYVFARV